MQNESNMLNASMDVEITTGFCEKVMPYCLINLSKKTESLVNS